MPCVVRGFGARNEEEMKKWGSVMGNKTVDLQKASEAYGEFLTALGVDRYAEIDILESSKMASSLMQHWTASVDLPKPVLSLMPAPDGGDRVVLSQLPFWSFCGHHFVPFFGFVTIDYLPSRFIAGLGGFLRIIDYYSRRPQFQENLTHEIANEIFQQLQPQHLIVELNARQMCLELNGHGAGISIQTHAERHNES